MISLPTIHIDADAYSIHRVNERARKHHKVRSTFFACKVEMDQESTASWDGNEATECKAIQEVCLLYCQQKVGRQDLYFNFLLLTLNQLNSSKSDSMCLNMLLGYSWSKAWWKHNWEQKWLLQETATQVKKLVKVAPQKPDTIRKRIKQDDTCETSSNKDVQHVIVFIVKFLEQEKVHVCQLESQWQHKVQEEQQEQTRWRCAIISSWLEVYHDTFCKGEVLILKVFVTLLFIFQETLSYHRILFSMSSYFQINLLLLLLFYLFIHVHFVCFSIGHWVVK